MRQLIVGYNGAGDAGRLVMDAAISVVQGGQCHDDVAVIIVARMPEEDFFCGCRCRRRRGAKAADRARACEEGDSFLSC